MNAGRVRNRGFPCGARRYEYITPPPVNATLSWNRCRRGSRPPQSGSAKVLRRIRRCLCPLPGVPRGRGALKWTGRECGGREGGGSGRVPAPVPARRRARGRRRRRHEAAKSATLLATSLSITCSQAGAGRHSAGCGAAQRSAARPVGLSGEQDGPICQAGTDLGCPSPPLPVRDRTPLPPRSPVMAPGLTDHLWSWTSFFLSPRQIGYPGVRPHTLFKPARSCPFRGRATPADPPSLKSRLHGSGFHVRSAPGRA